MVSQPNDRQKEYIIWLTYGIREGRSASPVLDLKYYIQNNSDLKKAYGTNYTNAYNHFCKFGYAEYRKSSPYYDGDYYRKEQKDLKNLYNGNIDEIAHLCFNARYYADTYPDLKKAYGYNEANLRNHWVTYGIKEGRSGSPILDLKYYIAHNPDLKKAYGTNYANAYYHFCRFGYAEFRNSSKYYNGTFYHLNHNDLAKYDSLFILNHYMTYGINEKRYGNTIRFTGAISPVSQSKTIPINWDNIAKVGKQAKGSVSCSCFALAYCRTILDNKVHNWSEYNQNGANQNNVWAMWSWGKYCSATGKNDNEVYTLAYHNINAGKPFIVYVKGGTNARKVNGGHYVAIVGYQNVTSLNSLSANNFLIIDPSSSAPLTGVENMGALAYSLNGCKYVYAQ